MKALKIFAYGDNLGAPTLSDTVLRREEITMPAFAFLLPNTQFWTANDVIVKTTQRNYTVNDYEDIFKDLGYRNGWEMYQDMIPYQSFAPPGVRTFCLYGTHVQTVESISYNAKDITSSAPIWHYGEGDGTVNAKSLKGCSRWVDQQQQKVDVFEFPHADHFTVLRDAEIIEKIISIIVSH